MSVAAFARRRKARHDHIGLKFADDPHDIGENSVAIPDRERLLRRFAEPEVERTREELFGAVDAARRQQLLRADDAEELAFFVADEVLAAVAARQRQITGAHAAIVD